MADIFVSYKKEDAGRVIRIVEGLRAEGFSVWWDHGIAPGAQWDQTIQRELDAAKVIIAIWSEQSIAAPWVKEEAGVGKSRGILLPIRIDDVDPPLGFSLIQMADLVGWNGDAKDPHWVLVLGAIRALLSGERPIGLEAAPRRKNPTGWILGAVVLVLAGMAGAAYLFTRAPTQIASGTGPPDIVQQAPQQTQTSATAPQATAPAASATPTEQEQAAWSAALDQRTRQAYQTYLVSFPDGVYAGRARDALLLCRTEVREVWREQRVGQIIRGVNSTPLPTQAAACAAARQQSTANGERACRAIAANDGYRSGRASFVESACECNQTPGGFFCTTDPGYTCAFEQRTQEQAEVCG